MKLEKKHIEHIKTRFSEMKSREELLEVLNYAKPFLYGDKTIPFELKQLTYYANLKRTKKSYITFEVKKKSGATRIINAPKKGLKALQKTLSLVLQCVFEPHKAATGFVMGKSVVDNAKAHTGSNYVYNIDLKDFFSSIDQARVWSCLKLEPFNLVDSDNNANKLDFSKLNTGVRKFKTDKNEEIFYKINSGQVKIIEDKEGNHKKYKGSFESKLPKFENSNLGISRLKMLRLRDTEINSLMFEDAKRYIFAEENIEQLKRLISNRKTISNMMAAICCTEMEVERMDKDGQWCVVKKSVLPQGAPTSPMLSNVVCQRLDLLLTGVANKFGLRYTRYADDITFSSMHNVYQKNGAFLKELNRIISDQGFHIKESKTRLQKTGQRKEVTGLLVNEEVNVQKRYIKQLRMWLYYWENYGFEKASTIFKQQYSSDKGHVKNGTPNIANVIGGKLDYLKMVKGANNPMYLKLKARFDKLSFKQSFLNTVLQVWEVEGIEKAMDVYYTRKKKILDAKKEKSMLEQLLLANKNFQSL